MKILAILFVLTMPALAGIPLNIDPVTGKLLNAPINYYAANPPAVVLGSSIVNVVGVGDSTTAGNGVSDVRQSYPAILSSLGFCLPGSTVTNFGFSGFTTASVNAILSTNESVPQWTGGARSSATVSTCPNTIGGTGNYAIYWLGTNDYPGQVLSGTISGTAVTSLSGTTYAAGRNLQIGDAVSGTGIQAGTVISAVNLGSSSITLSLPATSGTAVPLSFTPAVSNWLPTFQAGIATLKGMGYKVIVNTIPPANNTSSGVGNSQAQGNWQANRLAFNTAIRGLTYNGTGSNPDALCDLANLPAFQTFNASLFFTDMLHENFYGNQVVAQVENQVLLSLEPSTYVLTQAGQESVLDSQLSNNVGLINQAATVSGAWQFGSTGTNASIVLPVYSEIDINGSGIGVPAATLTLNSALGQNDITNFKQSGTQVGSIVVNAAGITISGSVGGNVLALSTSAGTSTMSYSGQIFSASEGFFQTNDTDPFNARFYIKSNNAPTGSRVLEFRNANGVMQCNIDSDDGTTTHNNQWNVTGGSSTTLGVFNVPGGINAPTYANFWVMTANQTGTVTFNTASKNESVYNTSASTLSALTITLPAASAVGQVVRYTTAGIVTTVTISGTVDIGTAITTLAANASIAYQCDVVGHWIRIQ